MYDAFKSLLGIATDLEAFYWIIAIISTLVFLFKLLFGSFGMEKEFQTDFSDGHFSLNEIFSFLKVAGWVGVISIRLISLAPVAAVSASLVAGVGAFFLARLILKNLKRLESSGTLDLESAVGKVGTVYLTIPKGAQNAGQVQVEAQGRLCTLDAISPDTEIKTGEKVLVYGVKDNRLLVEPYQDVTV